MFRSLIAAAVCFVLGAGCGAASGTVRGVRTTISTTSKVTLATYRTAATTGSVATRTAVTTARVASKTASLGAKVAEIPVVLIEGGPGSVARQIHWKSGLLPSEALLAAGIAHDPRLQAIQIVRGSSIIPVNPALGLLEPPLAPGDLLKLVSLGTKL